VKYGAVRCKKGTAPNEGNVSTIPCTSAVYASTPLVQLVNSDGEC
jgi:hypothetical protein